jgi:hypothetical protein
MANNTNIYQPAVVGETLTSPGGQFTFTTNAAAIGAAAVVIKAAPGRLCKVLITTATTASQPITFFDNATTGSGTIIGIIPGIASTGAIAGNVYVFDMPATNGITIGVNASLLAGAITISFL